MNSGRASATRPARKKKAEQTLAQRELKFGPKLVPHILMKSSNCAASLILRCQIEDKVGHLLKGIAEDVYNYLITKENLASALDVIRHCRAFETLKMRRITPKFGRLANVTTVASVDVGSSPSEDIASVVRRIIREELAQQGLCRDKSFHQCALLTQYFVNAQCKPVQSHSQDEGPSQSPPAASNPTKFECTRPNCMVNVVEKYIKTSVAVNSLTPLSHPRNKWPLGPLPFAWKKKFKSLAHCRLFLTFCAAIVRTWPTCAQRSGEER
ncbi:hypothetical protein HPB48_010927 [Haemaphysalis longicornis]|uniref:Uncharacterized protein n=1 Tax=Haemaphysalis longicornis TaxID=44386 RepID=A0A9J6H6L8_HAELO|nr:hypothetical protein HPB48_010927 [Haemaphysalis longicornis]